jgi:uncharacterized protein
MATAKDFSVIEKLKSLITIQKIDSKIDAIRVMRGELPIEVADLVDGIEGLNARKNRTEEEINGIQDFINQKKEAIKESQELINKYKKQSDDVKNSREFEAVNKELEMQELEVKLHEKHIKDAMEDIGEKAISLEKIKKEVSTKETNLKHKQDELDKITAETEKEEKAYQKQNETALSSLDERTQVSYNKIRSNFRNGLAVVPILRDACGGCFNAVPPQKQSEIRQHKKLMICENCGRILIDEDLFESVEVK